MKITDMNLICLEECLEHLELDDLLHVADSNKRLRKAAGSVFSRKYGTKCSYGSRFMTNSKFIVEYECLVINDQRICLRLLRCFGHLIVSWKRGDREDNELVLTYLNEYCAESLVEIVFSAVKADALDQLKRPFVNAKNVDLSRCHTTKAGWLKYVFPNMESLRYFESNDRYIDSIADHIPKLKHLSFQCHYSRDSDNSSRIKAIVDCCLLNPQLKTLSLYSQFFGKPLFDEASLRSMIVSLVNLEELELFYDFARFPKFTGVKIHSKSIKDFFYIQESKKIHGKCPFAFDRLESFRQEIQDKGNIIGFIEFIDRHPTIKGIGISNYNRKLINFNVTHLIKALPLLTEISLIGVAVSLDDVTALACELKFLQKIDLNRCGIQNSLNELRARLEDEWQVVVKESVIYLNRLTEGQ